MKINNYSNKKNLCMKKICLSLLLSCLGLGAYAISTSAIASVLVSDLNHAVGNSYEIFAFTNTQGSTATTTTSFKFVTKGTYTTDDIKTFYLYRNTTNTLVGATLIGSVTATPAGVQTISYPALNMPDTTTLYYMIYATVAENATKGHTISVYEISNTTDTPFAFTGEQPIYISSKAESFHQLRLADLGQLQFDPSHPFNSFILGINLGYTTIYGDLATSDHKPVINLSFGHHVSDYGIISLNLSHGLISSHTTANSWTTGLGETNQFTALDLSGRLSISAFIYHPKNTLAKLMSKCYLGAGLGFIDNDLTAITRKFKENATSNINSDIKTNTVALILPVNLGINIDLRKILDYRGAQLNINYNLSYSFNDYIDGYSFSKATTRNQYNDAYSVVSVGFSFYIGHIVEKR